MIISCFYDVESSKIDYDSDITLSWQQTWSVYIISKDENFQIEILDYLLGKDIFIMDVAWHFIMIIFFFY